MRCYQEYKDSAIEWVGIVPSHWSVVPIHKAFVEENRINEKLDRILALKFSAGSIVPKPEQWDLEDVGETYAKYRMVDPGTIVINNLNLNFDLKSQRVGRVEQSGIITSAYIAIVPTEIVDERFAEYAFKAWDYKKAFHNMGRGLRLTLDWNELKRYYFALPSIEEQRAIADYLTIKTAEIDSLIKETEKSIELLEEYRKSVISEAVTKGLNSDASMKESGIEWIGAMPKHWKLVPISLLTSKIGSGKTPKGGSSVYPDDGVMFLRSQNVYDDGLCLDNVAFIASEVDEEMKGTRVYPGDVLLNITGGSIGRCCVYDQEEHANVNQHVCIMRPTISIDPLYLQFFWNSCLGSISIAICQMGQNRESINFEQIGSVKIPLPPKSEQLAIVEILVEKLEWISQMKKCSGALKDLLIEYRKSLISEAVTGKFKVPGVM